MKTFLKWLTCFQSQPLVFLISPKLAVAYVHVTLTNSGVMPHHRWSLGGRFRITPVISRFIEYRNKPWLGIPCIYLAPHFPSFWFEYVVYVYLACTPTKADSTHAMITHAVLHDAHKYNRSNCHMEITRLPDVFCFLLSTTCCLM